MQRPNLIQSAILGLATTLLLVTQPLAALAAPSSEPIPLVQASSAGDGLLNPETGVIGCFACR